MPNKFNADRRHHIPKTAFKVTKGGSSSRFASVQQRRGDPLERSCVDVDVEVPAFGDRARDPASSESDRKSVLSH
jgi:hypothetical protein